MGRPKGSKNRPRLPVEPAAPPFTVEPPDKPSDRLNPRWEDGEKPRQCPTCKSPHSLVCSTQTDEHSRSRRRYRQCECGQRWVSIVYLPR